VPVIERFTSETFRDHIGETFRIRPTKAEGVEFETTLTSCEETPYGDPDQWMKELSRIPFSLTFSAAEGQLVPQQICQIAHDELGEFELFLVPIGPHRELGGMQYHAVIN
jgi:hypothetical protein